jgi:hypothetical protein
MNLTELKAVVAKVEAELNGANPDEVHVFANGRKIKEFTAMIPAKIISNDKPAEQ